MESISAVSFRELCNKKSGLRNSIHSLHSYPAQLIPQIPLFFLREIDKKSSESTVLDPFCGTGTVMVEAMRNGWNSIGVDVNPIAALIAKVKTTIVSEAELEENLEFIVNLFHHLNDARIDSPKFKNLSFWFDEKAIEVLAKIKYCLGKISNKDMADFFKVIFSSIVKDVSRADPRIYVPVLPNDDYKQTTSDPWLLFKNKAKTGIRQMTEFSNLLKKPSPSCKIFCEDVRNFDVNRKNIDLIITSPPYISAQKYLRSVRLQAYWLGYDVDKQQKIEESTIGTERTSTAYYSSLQPTGYENLDELIKRIYEKNKERAGIVSKYFIEMEQALNHLFSILNSEGVLILVIGTNTAAKYAVDTNKFLMKICEDIGFSVERIMEDKIVSRGLMTKRNATAGIIDYEWVIQMRKQ